MALEGHHEFPPYNPDTLRSVYHIRNVEVFKLKQVNIADPTFSFAHSSDVYECIHLSSG